MEYFLGFPVLVLGVFLNLIIFFILNFNNLNLPLEQLWFK